MEDSQHEFNNKDFELIKEERCPRNRYQGQYLWDMII